MVSKAMPPPLRRQRLLKPILQNANLSWPEFELLANLFSMFALPFVQSDLMVR
jgi:hypothetical protein